MNHKLHENLRTSSNFGLILSITTRFLRHRKHRTTEQNHRTGTHIMEKAVTTPEDPMLNFDCREIPKQRPVVIRHHMSGVWIGWIKGQGMLSHLLVLEGRRVYSWKGKRLETSQIAKYGVSAEDTLCEWETLQIPVGVGDGLVEIHGTSDALVEAARALPSKKV